MAKTEKQKIGSWGEEKASIFLSEKGYSIIERNYKVNGGKGGEIDIICWHDKYHFGKTLCFIEVKTRSYGVGTAERATKGSKLKKLQSAAKYYCADKSINIDSQPIQFEQVSVYFSGKKQISYNHHTIPIE